MKSSIASTIQFRTAPQYGQPNARVDRENGIIYGVQVIRPGEARGHDVNVNAQFCADIVAQGNAIRNGLKSRFNHPSACFGAMGTMLGTLRNFRQDANTFAAIADLHVSPVASKSPNGDLAEYVFSMAENHPDHFGLSIDFERQNELLYEDADGNFVPAAKEEDYSKKLYVQLATLRAADVVDDPAATDGLFSAEINSDLFAVQITQFLDSNPAIWQFAEKHPEVIEKFITQYRNYTARKGQNTNTDTAMQKPKFSFARWVNSWFTAHKANFDIPVTDTDGNQLRIVTDSDMLEVGKEVVIVPDDGTEPYPAPDGNYTIQGGDNDGKVLAVTDGKIADISEPEPMPESGSTDVTTQMSAEMATLLDTVNGLKQQIEAQQAEITALKSRAAARHSDPDTDEDYTTTYEADSTDDYTEELNREGRAMYERMKKGKPKK